MISLVPQRKAFDCGVAALSMWGHIEYEDAYALAISRFGASVRYGLQLKEMRLLAKLLGHDLRVVHYRRVDLEDDSGILGVNWTTMSGGHWVVLRKGTIIDPAKAQVWDADEYIRTHEARVGSLLTEDV